jgi:hypothetical protein
LRRVKLYSWPAPGLPHGNFGDEITVPILERLFSIEAVKVDTHQAELLGAGSILQIHAQMAPPRPASPRRLWRWLQTSRTLHVWGTGLIRQDAPVEWPQEMIVCATRGALSADALDADVPHGDPGILASLLLERRPAKRAGVGLVPHYVDMEDLRMADLPHGWTIIDPRQPVHAVIEAIAAAELVVSSSLHGLIVADSLGIPCIWAKTAERLAGSPDFKFRDHATARRRSFGEPVSYEEALRSAPGRLAGIATVPARPVAEWQDELIAAFPFR